MKYRDKFIFGIFEDTPSFKIVQMRWYNGTAMLLNLQKTMLEKSFYADRIIQDEDQTQDEADLYLSGVTGVMEMQEPGVEETQTLDAPSSKVIPPEVRLMDSLQIDNGRIALNSNDERLVYYTLNYPAKSKNIHHLIRKEILKPEDRKNPDLVYGIVPQEDSRCTVIIHRGQNNLFEYLWRYNRIHSTKRFFYALIDPNDISLLNIVNLNYDFPEDDFVLILYLGFEYKKGILLRNRAFVKAFTIQTASNLFTNRDEIYSKLMLEQDEAQLPEPQHILLAGENSKNEDVAYFQKKFPKSDVSRIFLRNLLVSEDTLEPITEEDIAEFIIPISLAWKTMDSTNKSTINTNFLPKKIIEGQKIFKLAWHGFVILFALFFFTAYATKNFLVSSQDLIRLKRSNMLLETEYRQYNEKMQQSMAGIMSVANLEGQEAKINGLLKGKNHWGYILTELSRSFQAHPHSWIVNIKSENDRFMIIGKTMNRAYIPDFAKVFPNGKIVKVSSEELLHSFVWNFEINYKYPNMDEVIAKRAAATATIEQAQVPQPEKPILKHEVKNTAKPAVTKVKSVPSTPGHVTTNAKAPEVKQTASKAQSPDDDVKLIKTLYSQDKNAKVLEMASKFYKLHPKHPFAPMAHYLIGESLFSLDRYQESIPVLESIVSSGDDKAPEALYIEGRCYEAMGDSDKAKALWRKSLNSYPDSEVAPKLRKVLGR